MGKFYQFERAGFKAQPPDKSVNAFTGDGFENPVEIVPGKTAVIRNHVHGKVVKQIINDIIHGLVDNGRSPEGWLKLQLQYDLWKAKQSADIGNLKRIEAA